jgi:hypothetical protein
MRLRDDSTPETARSKKSDLTHHTSYSFNGVQDLVLLLARAVKLKADWLTRHSEPHVPTLKGRLCHRKCCNFESKTPSTLAAETIRQRSRRRRGSL